MPVATLLSALFEAASSAKASCYIFTDSPGMVCPLCGLDVKPNVGHACNRKAPAKGRAVQVRGRRANDGN